MSPLAKPETKKAQRERERLVSDLTEAQRAFDDLKCSERVAIVNAIHAEQAGAMMDVKLASGKLANKRSVAVEAARAEELKLKALAAWPDCEATIVGDGDLFRIYYWRDTAALDAAAALARTPYRDAQPGQSWEVRVSGRLAFVVLEWVGTRDSRFVKVNRKKFRGTNSATGRQVDGDLARLRRRVA